MYRSLRAGAVLAFVLALPASLPAQESARRPLRTSDLYRVRDVRDPQASPDGEWIAYTVSHADSARDRNDTDVWMVSWEGGPLRLTGTSEAETTPRWSPDGRHLTFLSSRQDAGSAQVWLMDHLGGEATRLTDVRGGVSGYAWSPDGKKLALVVSVVESEDSVRSRTPVPIVIDRFFFKSDNAGYLGGRRNHIYLYDLESRTAELLTPGPYDEESPAWSPDGTMLAFVSKRGEDPDRSLDSNIYVMEARPGAPIRQLTRFPGSDDAPVWSPDGRSIAYLQGGDPKFSAYNLDRLAVVPVSGGTPRVLTGELDRSVAAPQWSPDGAALLFLVTDDRTRYLARVRAAGGPVERLTTGKQVVAAFSQGPNGRVAVLTSTPARPAEIYTLERGVLHPLTAQNAKWLAEVRLAATEEFSARARDGNTVNGLAVMPPDYRPGARYPTLLRIHGGPNAQDQHEFNFERELFAAHGYVVVAANYRGSAGRGEAYSTSIFADWGNKEVVDLLASVDHLVAQGVADPERLGIGGWSYGGILTNYVIASDPRFRAAISGAASSLQLSMYGTDQYIAQYEAELGTPWKNREAWIRISYPFFHADRIRTPTLFMVGEKDFNVPAIGSEQMYQALRSLNVPTQLVIYPGEHHTLGRPSFRVDRYRRYLGWYERYLVAPAAPVAATQLQ